MPTYLYCILPAGGDVPRSMPAGVGGGTVRVLPAGSIDAWVETISDRSVSPSIDAARRHDAVVTSALELGETPLPARFNQVFDSDEQCVAALNEAADRMQEDLTRVRGMVEMRIIARLRTENTRPEAVTAATPGTAYMHRLQRQRQLEQIVQASAAAVRRRLTETVGAFVRGEAVSLDPLPAAVLTLSHLVPRNEVPAYRAALQHTPAGVDVERLVVSGPVAPYQFVSAAR